MAETLGIPESAKTILKKIDNALMHLAKDDFAYFVAYEKKLRELGLTARRLGLEHPLRHELYCLLKKTFGDIVYPELQRIDLTLCLSEYPVYLELGNHYGEPNKYPRDCQKLVGMLGHAAPGMGVLIHLNLSEPRHHSVHGDFKNLPGDSKSYWRDYTELADIRNCADDSPRHFVRLAFGPK